MLGVDPAARSFSPGFVTSRHLDKTGVAQIHGPIPSGNLQGSAGAFARYARQGRGRRRDATCARTMERCLARHTAIRSHSMSTRMRLQRHNALARLRSEWRTG